MPTIPLKYIISLIMIAALAGTGWYAKHEHDLLVSFEAKVKQAGIDQDKAAKLKDAENDQTKLYIAQSYSDELNRLQQRARSGQLSKAPNSTSGPDAAQQEPSSACKGTEFYNNALEDALKLKYWQEWAMKLNLPVGN